MNARIAALLKDRISQFTYVDKLAGLVRAISYERNGERITVPVCDDVDDQLACSDTAMRDMVPDAAYQAIVYFEDRGMQSIQSRTRGLSYRSSLRLVCWINTAKFGSDSEAGSKVMQQFIGAIDDGPYTSSPFLGIRHRVEGVPQRGPGLFSPYTYPESARQYLLYPYDAFALDITTELRIIPGCEDEVTLGNDECWTAPTQRRRRFPREFSCEELNDAATGLTDEQKEDCLDCEGGGECDPGTVLRDGIPYGTVASGDSIDVPSNCPDPCDVVATLVNDAELVPCIPSGDRTAVLCALMQMPEITVEAVVVCADGAGLTAGLQAALCPSCGPLTIRINGVDYSEVSDPCDTVAGVRVKDAADNDVGSLDGTTWRIPSVTVQLKDSANNNIGSADSYLPGANTSKTAPDATVQLKDSAGVNIGSADSYRSNTSNNKTAPDGTVTINNSVPTTLHTVAVKSNGSATQAIADSTITKPDGTTAGLPATVALDVRDYRSGIAYQFGKKDWSGQTTEYRTGDEKDIFDAGFFDYTRPVYPTHYAELGSNFTTLAANNSFGNTNRFTDEAGNAVATSGNRYILDHLTGLMWYRPSSLPTAATWNDAIDACEAASTGGYTDWHMPPINLLMQLVQYEASVNLNYGGFLITVSLWSGTTNPYSTTQARASGATSSVTEVNAFKTGTLSYIYCRRFI